jgi:hypothetical protein
LPELFASSFFTSLKACRPSSSTAAQHAHTASRFVCHMRGQLVSLQQLPYGVMRPPHDLYFCRSRYHPLLFLHLSFG